jgi:hypothetical protein
LDENLSHQKFFLSMSVSNKTSGWTTVSADKTVKRKKPLAKRPPTPAPKELSKLATFVYEILLQQYPPILAGHTYLSPEDLLERLLRQDGIDSEYLVIDDVWRVLDDELDSVLNKVSRGAPTYAINQLNSCLLENV